MPRKKPAPVDFNSLDGLFDKLATTQSTDCVDRFFPTTEKRESGQAATVYQVGSVTADNSAFVIPPAGREAHTHILGGTKRGKSVLMEQLIRHDLDNPDCSLCLIDPHNGSTYDHLLRYVAYERPELAERIVLFNPAEETEMILGFNPLGKSAQENPHYALNMIVSACLKAWGQDRTDATPRITRWLENIFYLIIANSLTILETAPLISSRKHNPYREKLLRQVENFFIEEDWNDFFEATSTVRNQHLEGAHNRLRKFLRNPYLQRVFGQQQHILDIDRIVNEKKILLVKLPDGQQIDREGNQMIGTLLIHEIFRAMLARDPQQNPHPFYLYIDEFGQFVTREIAYLLEEARKYGLYLTIAHQHLAQLREQDEYLYASILTNCHNRVIFGGLSFEDAEIMDREINTGFQDLLSIKHEIWNTKFRPVEEWRASYGFSHGESRGQSAAFGLAFGRAQAVGESLARGIAWGRGETKGTTRQASKAEGGSNGTSRQVQNGWSQDQGLSQGISASEGETFTQGKNRGRTTTDSESESSQTGTSASLTRQENEQHSNGHTMSAQYPGPRSYNNQDGTGSSIAHQDSTQRSRGEQRGHAQSNSEGTSEQHGFNRSRGRNESHSRRQGNSRSEGASTQQGSQWNVSQTLGRQHSLSNSRTDSETRTSSKTNTVTEQESYTGGRQESSSNNASVSYQLGTRHEEFREMQPVFHSLQELQFMGIAALKNQSIGEATFQIGPTSPVQVQIDYRPPPAYHLSYTPERLQAFRRRVFARQTDMYQSVTDAIREIEQRQREIFGEVIQLDFKGEVVVSEGLPPPADPTSAESEAEQPEQRSIFGDDEQD